MKKSKTIMLTGLFLSAIACAESEPEAADEWISGNENGQVRDTAIQDNRYRYYGGYWYPVYGNSINPGMHRGASLGEISKPGFAPSSLRRGGFGSTARYSSGG